LLGIEIEPTYQLAPELQIPDQSLAHPDLLHRSILHHIKCFAYDAHGETIAIKQAIECESWVAVKKPARLELKLPVISRRTFEVTLKDVPIP
jgi:hypothetical protein